MDSLTRGVLGFLLCLAGSGVAVAAEEPPRNHSSRAPTAQVTDPSRELPPVTRDSGQDSTLSGSNTAGVNTSNTGIPTCTDPSAINYDTPADRCYYSATPIVDCGPGAPGGFDPATCACPAGQEEIGGVCVPVCGPAEVRDPVSGVCVCDPTNPVYPSGNVGAPTCACPPGLVDNNGPAPGGSCEAICPLDAPSGNVGLPTCACPPPLVDDNGAAPGGTCDCPVGTPTFANPASHPLRPCECEPPAIDVGGICKIPACPAGTPVGANDLSHPTRPCQCEPPEVHDGGVCREPTCPAGTPAGANDVSHPTRPCQCEPPEVDDGGVCREPTCPAGTPVGANDLSHPTRPCQCEPPEVDNSGFCGLPTCPPSAPSGNVGPPTCDCPPGLVDSNGPAAGGICDAPGCPDGTPSGANPFDHPTAPCECPAPFEDSNGAAFGGVCECPPDTVYDAGRDRCEPVERCTDATALNFGAFERCDFGCGVGRPATFGWYATDDGGGQDSDCNEPPRYGPPDIGDPPPDSSCNAMSDGDEVGNAFGCLGAGVFGYGMWRCRLTCP